MALPQPTSLLPSGRPLYVYVGVEAPADVTAAAQRGEVVVIAGAWPTDKKRWGAALAELCRGINVPSNDESTSRLIESASDVRPERRG